YGGHSPVRPFRQPLEPPATRVPLAARASEVNALAGRVIFDLVLRELEPDQLLERRTCDSALNRRVGHGIDRRFGLPSLARPRKDGADVRRKSRGSAIDPYRRLDA